LLKKVSTKKAMRARCRAPSTLLEGGTRWDGCASARNWATMADSVMMLPL
jgi:hypothetical protein